MADAGAFRIAPWLRASGQYFILARRWHILCCILSCHSSKGGQMLRYAVIFFVIALIAAVFGFTGIASGATEIAKILFLVFIVIAIVGFVAGLVKKR
jgi:uncharacterized membrane protein YtjA (UPF0391 family)